MYLAFDPGETTGWAWADKNGMPMPPKSPTTNPHGQISNQDALIDFLEALNPVPSVIIVEKWKLSPDQSKGMYWTEMITPQNIGIIKAYARRHQVEIVWQETGVKKAGYGLAMLKPTSNHRDSHWRDAKAHLEYYLARNKVKPIRRPV